MALDEDKIVPYWEFRYRRDYNSPDRNYVTFDKSTIPAIVKDQAVERGLRVPLNVWAQKSFDPYALLKHYKYIMERSLNHHQP